MNTDHLIIEKFLSSHPAVALPIIEDLEVREIALLLESLPPDLSILILNKMVTYKAARTLEHINSELAVKLIQELPLTVSGRLLRQVNKTLCDSLLSGLTPETSNFLRRTLEYPRHTAGAHLDPSFFILTNELTIGQGLERVKRDPQDVREHIFVTDRDHSLIGWIELKDLVTNNQDGPIHTVIHTEFPRVLADMRTEDVLKTWDNRFNHLPVVNLEDTFLGTISRQSMTKINAKEKIYDPSALKASNALSELYLIGFSSIFWNPTDDSLAPTQK